MAYITPVKLAMAVMLFELYCAMWNGYGSTDLQLFTSTKLKIVNYWLYSPMH